MKSLIRGKTVLAFGVMALTATASGAAAAAPVKIDYWMWDPDQLPAYQKCAATFEQANPNIKVRITQRGWDPYWVALTTGLISGTAPDVFVNHLSRYPEFMLNKQIVDLRPLIERDGVPTALYRPGLYGLWGRDGRQYGLPKDWDTAAVVYNAAMLAEAGVTPEELDNADWNPQDGGTFGRIMAKLTRDRNGADGTAPDFNPKAVERYGLTFAGVDGFGQDSWAPFALSNGFRYQDGPWSTTFHYDDPQLAETLSWLVEVSRSKGHMAPVADIKFLSGQALFKEGKAAMMTGGSWLIRWFSDNVPFAFAYARLPEGKFGRKTVFNGLADSIWSGSKHQQEAWEWVKFLASPSCQTIVGDAGAVFPAIPEASERARKTYAGHGLDLSAFFAVTGPEHTVLYPIADRMGEIKSITTSAIEKILIDKAPVEPILTQTQKKIDALFQ